MTPRRRVHVLALPGCTAIVPVGIAELLRKSAELAAAMDPGAPVIELKLISGSSRRTIRGAGDLRLACDATIADAGPCDLVVVPALDPDVLERLERHRMVLPWLRRAFEAGADLASACTGAFLLAEAGLLDGRAATTHWAFQGLFAERYRRVRLEPQAVLVDQGRIATAGGATSFMNLALLLVERLLGAEVARAASRMFLIEPNRAPQGAYAMFSTQKGHGDEAILRAQTLIERDVARAPSVGELARRVAMSGRTFARRFRQATGNSPLAYIQRVRVEAAKRLLEKSGEPMSSVAERVGHADAVAFRKLFSRLTGLTPLEYRARYGALGPPLHVGPPRKGARGRRGLRG